MLRKGVKQGRIPGLGGTIKYTSRRVFHELTPSKHEGRNVPFNVMKIPKEFLDYVVYYESTRNDIKLFFGY